MTHALLFLLTLATTGVYAANEGFTGHFDQGTLHQNVGGFSVSKSANPLTAAHDAGVMHVLLGAFHIGVTPGDKIVATTSDVSQSDDYLERQNAPGTYFYLTYVSGGCGGTSASFSWNNCSSCDGESTGSYVSSGINAFDASLNTYPMYSSSGSTGGTMGSATTGEALYVDGTQGTAGPGENRYIISCRGDQTIVTHVK